MTIHCGEEGGDVAVEEMWEVLESLRPARIGHGILATRDAALMTELASRGVVLELCPTSNLLTRALPDQAALARTVRRLSGAGVPWTVATDGPEMMRTRLKDEFELLLSCGAATAPELDRANRRAHDASFIG